MTRFEKPVDHAMYREGDSDSNRILLLALWKRWGKRCYINNCVKDFSDFQIEHIIPRTMPTTDVEKNVKEYGSASVKALDFDVDAPHNLAPACNKCNRDKNNRDFTAAGYLMTALAKACTWEPDVRKRVAAFRKTDAVTKSMLSMSIADLKDPASKSALMSLGPVVVDRLRMVAPEALAGESTYSFRDPNAAEYDCVAVTLDERGRRAAVIVEDVYEGDFDEFLRVAVRAVWNEISVRLKASLESHLKDEGHHEPVVGDPDGRREVTVNEVVFDVADCVFHVRGFFDADGAASAVVIDAHGDSEDTTGYADPIEGSFEVQVWFDDGDSVFEADDAVLL